MRKYKLSELFDLQMGKTPARNNPEYWENGTNPWISISDITSNGKYIIETKEYITDKAVYETGIKAISPGTVIMSFKLSVGKVARTMVKSYSNEAIMAFEIKDVEPSQYMISDDYAYYLLSALNFDNVGNKAVMGKTLNKAILENTEVCVHKWKKQLQIVFELDKVSNIISLYKQELEKLDELVKVRFVEMFGDPIRNTQNRPTTDFINIIKMQRGFDLPVQDRQQDGDIPVYGSNGALDRHNVAKVSGGGVITGRSGTIGKVFYCEGDYWPLNTSLFSVDTHGNNIIYLAYLLQMYDLSRFTEGTGVPTLNRNKFHNKPIIDVPIDEQEIFATFVKQTDKSKLTIQKSLEKLETLKKALMQKYFG
ncbi:MAG: restriction endonuclease subunit S [Acutalibacteraceae bacterium]